jgi:hypothetical protein
MLRCLLSSHTNGPNSIEVDGALADFDGHNIYVRCPDALTARPAISCVNNSKCNVTKLQLDVVSTQVPINVSDSARVDLAELTFVVQPATGVGLVDVKTGAWLYVHDVGLTTPTLANEVLASVTDNSELIMNHVDVNIATNYDVVNLDTENSKALGAWSTNQTVLGLAQSKISLFQNSGN